MTEDIGLDDISRFLLHNKYNLTALEFDFELIERGIENKTLRNFFTNPMNFECVSSFNDTSNTRLKSSPSISTIDSIDFAKYSDDGLQQYDERIKVLEFELRKKNDEVRKLREELTHMSVSTVHTSYVLDWLPGNTDDSEVGHGDSLLAHENRTLNFLINEYLLQQRLKLTAVSFSEEVSDQDLDSWDDVGLNIPKLPSLEHLLKTKLTALVDVSAKLPPVAEVAQEDLEVQTEPEDDGPLEQLKVLCEHLQERVRALEQEAVATAAARAQDAAEMRLQTQTIAEQKRDLNDARSKLICAQRDLVQESLKKKVSAQAALSVSGDTDAKSETVSDISNVLEDAANGDRGKYASQMEGAGEDSNDHQESGYSEAIPQRNVTKDFMRMLQLTQDPEGDAVTTSVPLVASLDEFVHLTAEALPRLFEASSSKDDPDLMMLLVQTTCLHPDSKHREKLLKFLINLYPEPSLHQRNLVIRQIQVLAGYLGPFRVEAELITQIWEMLYEKPKLNPSKRILLANICGVVCPLAPPNLRSSLILSIHQQMLEEESDQKVVPHILVSIASTVPHLEDVDKIAVLVQLTCKYLLRPSPGSVDSHKQDPKGEPSSEEVVRTKLLPAVAQWCLDAGVLHCSLVQEVVGSMALQTTVGDRDFDHQGIHRHLHVLHLLLPFLEVWVKGSAPGHADEEPEDEVWSTTVVPSREPDLYLCSVIVSPQKYCEMQARFHRYTGANFPQSLMGTPPNPGPSPLPPVPCWSPWPQLRWLQTELVSKLVAILKDIVPKCPSLDLKDGKVVSDLAKGQFTYTSNRSKEICTRTSRLLFDLCCLLSPPVVQSVVVPCIAGDLYQSSTKGVDCDLKTGVITTGLVAGHCAVLASLSAPTNLSHPSSFQNPTASYKDLRRFLTDTFFLIAAENLPCDGVKHSVSVLCACLGSPAVLEVVLPAMQPCIACSECSVQMLMCIVLLELVSSLSEVSCAEEGVLQSLVDCLRQLVASTHESVRVLTIGPLVGLLQLPAASADLKAQIFSCLTDLMRESVNLLPEATDPASPPAPCEPCSEIIVTALIQMINVVGPSSPDSFRDHAILPWLLGITEVNNGTADLPRRAAVAMILYSTFSTLSYYLESSSVLETCLLPSLDRLRLDMLEIYPENVKEVESMSHEIRKRIDSKTARHGSSDSISQAMKGKISGLNFIGRTSSVSSSATSSLMGRFRDIKEAAHSSKTDDQFSSSSSTSSAKANLAFFFSKRK